MAADIGYRWKWTQFSCIYDVESSDLKLAFRWTDWQAKKNLGAKKENLHPKVETIDKIKLKSSKEKYQK